MAGLSRRLLGRLLVGLRLLVARLLVRIRLLVPRLLVRVLVLRVLLAPGRLLSWPHGRVTIEVAARARGHGRPPTRGWPSAATRG